MSYLDILVSARSFSGVTKCIFWIVEFKKKSTVEVFLFQDNDFVKYNNENELNNRPIFFYSIKI